MPHPRASRNPLLLTAAEQRTAVDLADHDETFRKNIEILFGLDWMTLTFQAKLAAIQRYEQLGRAASVMAASHRGIRDLDREVMLATGQVATEDRIRYLEDQNRDQAETIAELNARLSRKGGRTS